MENKKMKRCPVCDAEIAKNAKTCPNCGAKNTKSLYKRWWVWLVAVILLMGIGGNKENTVSLTESNEEKVQTTGIDAIEKDESISNTEEAVPNEYKAALKKASSYSKLMNMSKAAIYDQLVAEYGEQFSQEAAEYAMGNLEADFKNNALIKAGSYSDNLYMSKAAIYDQLTSEFGEKFTAEEAQYAVDNLKADYKANALEKAKTYQSMMNMSKAAIYDQLVSSYGEKFTAEEAQYAIDNLDG